MKGILSIVRVSPVNIYRHSAADPDSQQPCHRIIIL